MENKSTLSNGVQISPGGIHVPVPIHGPSKASKDADNLIVDTSTSKLNGLRIENTPTHDDHSTLSSPLKSAGKTTKLLSRSNNSSNFTRTVKFEPDQSNTNTFPAQSSPPISPATTTSEDTGKFNLYEASIESVKYTRKTVVSGGQIPPKRKITTKQIPLTEVLNGSFDNLLNM